MKIKTFFISFLLTISISGHSQKKLPDFSVCPVVNPEYRPLPNTDYTLIVVSGAGCGYCARALDYLLDMDTLNNLEIIIYDFGKLERIEELHGKYFEKYRFIQGDNCDAYKSKMLLPTFFLYKDSKLVWKHKGQEKSKNNIEEIKSIVKA